MARTVYYIRSHEADGTNEYTQITGTEFYSLVSTEEGKKRCFIRLVEEDSSDAPIQRFHMMGFVKRLKNLLAEWIPRSM